MLRWLSEFAAQGILVTDADLTICSCNKWFEKQLGQTEKDLISRNLLEVFPELKARGFDRYYLDALNGQSRVLSHRLHKYLLPMTPSAGAAAFAQMQQSARISPLLAGDEVIGTITFIEEVTDRVIREMELQAQLEERERLLASENAARQLAESNSLLKDEFLATVSHEIRAPLNAISGWTQILRNGNLDSNGTQHALDTIQRNVHSQAQIIEDLLDISRIVAGQMRLDFQPVTLAESIKSALEVVQPTAAVKAITLIDRIESDSIVIMGDNSRLQQIFWNLLSNAIKFTPPKGQIEVVLRKIDAFAQITVNDTGEGISADFLPFIFDRFRQADGSSKRKYGGLGLGLSIVKNLIEMHGGTITVQSPGRDLGTAFTIMFPLLLNPKNDAMINESSNSLDGLTTKNLEGLRILIMDDDADSREMLKFFLETRHMKVLSASSAIEALRLFSAFKPDLIITDLGMPEIDGYDLLKKIRAFSEDNGGNTPVIALTGYAGLEVQARVKNSGFNSHIVKPVEPNNVLLIISQILKNKGYD